MVAKTIWVRALNFEKITFAEFTAKIMEVMRDIPPGYEKYVIVSIDTWYDDDDKATADITFTYCREETTEEANERIRQDKEKWKRDPDRYLEEELEKSFWRRLNKQNPIKDRA
jgi:DNA modification methylase